MFIGLYLGAIRGYQELERLPPMMGTQIETEMENEMEIGIIQAAGPP